MTWIVPWPHFFSDFQHFLKQSNICVPSPIVMRRIHWNLTINKNKIKKMQTGSQLISRWMLPNDARYSGKRKECVGGWGVGGGGGRLILNYPGRHKGRELWWVYGWEDYSIKMWTLLYKKSTVRFKTINKQKSQFNLAENRICFPLFFVLSLIMR